MISKSLVLAVGLAAMMVSCVGVSPCPIANHNGTVYSGTPTLTQAKSSWATTEASSPSPVGKTPNAIITVYLMRL